MQVVALCPIQTEAKAETAPSTQLQVVGEEIRRRFGQELARYMAVQLATVISLPVPQVQEAGQVQQPVEVDGTSGVERALGACTPDPHVEAPAKVHTALLEPCQVLPSQVLPTDVAELELHEQEQTQPKVQSQPRWGDRKETPQPIQVEVGLASMPASRPGLVSSVPQPVPQGVGAVQPQKQPEAGKTVSSGTNRSDEEQLHVEALPGEKVEPHQRRETASANVRGGEERTVSDNGVFGHLRRVESTPEATAGTESPRGATAQEPARVAEGWKPSTTRLSLTLDKGEPGEIVVRLSLRKDTVWGRLTVNDEGLRQQLQDQLDQLRHQLSESGLTLGQLQVDSGGSGNWDREGRGRLPRPQTKSSQREGKSDEDDVLLDERV